MQATHVNDTSTTTVPGAMLRRWTVRDAFDRSRPVTRALVTICGAIALLCTTDPRIPVACGVAVAALVPAVLVDLIEHRLPNRLVAMAALLGATALAASELLGGGRISPTDGAVGAFSLAGPLVIAHLLAPSSMGLGDIKAALVLGAALGLVDPMLALGALAVGSAGTAVTGLVARRRTIAFGPGLFAGAVTMLLLVVANSVAIR